ncbi:hypothetical protein RUM44_008355 [Polyplax serrata]|uniref:Uncharacterized protein n=1 Tax=Polyplax serrata TaxID=468196 RepID=A0ABR1BCY1_POLSC
MVDSSYELIVNFTELKLDGLINGTNLAPYSNFRNWSEESVPVIRNYLSNQGVSPNSSRCLIQTAQDIYIEYTSAFTESGYPIHRVIGLRVDRFARNTTLRTFWGVLTSRAVFLYVPSSKVPPQTRFWRRMLSPELSENAWLNIFNAFDGDQQEENTFWCITLGIALLAGVAATRLTVDCGEFLLLTLTKYVHGGTS